MRLLGRVQSLSMPSWVWPSACFLIQPQIGRMLEQVGGSPASVFRIEVTDLLEGRNMTCPQTQAVPSQGHQWNLSPHQSQLGLAPVMGWGGRT